MANVNNSPNMILPIPAVGIESGPQWASDINASLTLIDQHNHAPGSGVQITPNGLNINTDLPFNSHNATQLMSTQYISQATAISATYALQFVGKELVVNDGAGNHVQITLNGSVVGTPGAITGLTSPASASYSSSTFIFQSNVNVAANLDAASILLRLPAAGSPALTLSAPSSMTNNYTLTLPTIPATTSFMVMDNVGNMSTSITTASLLTGITSSNIVPGSIVGTSLATNINLPGTAAQEAGRNLVVSGTNATTSLAIVRGLVGIAGTVEAGEGFTVTHTISGIYDLLWTNPFSDTPVITATIDGSAQAGIVNINSSSSTGASVEIITTVASSVNLPFHFIAIGQR